ncbi:hypothetical protein TrRE_jg4098, partial [Triparma retinervis]
LNTMCASLDAKPMSIESELSWYLSGGTMSSPPPSFDPDFTGGSITSSWADIDKNRVDVIQCFDTKGVEDSMGDIPYHTKSILKASLDPKYYYTKELLSYVGESIEGTKATTKVSVKFGDGKGGVGGGPTMRKVRRCGTDGGMGGNDGIIYKAGAWRHYPVDLWTTLYEDVEWGKKRDRAAWRGSTTGCHDCYPNVKYDDYRDDPRGSTDGEGSGNEAVAKGGYGSRAELVRRMSYLNGITRGNSKVFDLGVSLYKQNVANLWGTKPFLSKAEQMGNKIIIIAEGNDIATGSKWAMLSGSVVVMTKPVICSWLLEDAMVPGVHYLEVKWDWSDLVEKVEWCFENDEECEKIGKMGQCWMRRFLDDEREKYLTEAVVKEAVKMQKVKGYCGAGLGEAE